jgi:hypothetical protein
MLLLNAYLSVIFWYRPGRSLKHRAELLYRLFLNLCCISNRWRISLPEFGRWSDAFVCTHVIREVGYGWGISCFGFVTVLIAPSPLLFYYFGERIRERIQITF